MTRQPLPTSAPDREAALEALPMRCPLDGGELRPEGGRLAWMGAHHRRECARCGLRVLFPRVPALRALRRLRRI